MGDIPALAASIAAVGLLHPVVINTNDRLVAGLRGIRAAERLGWLRGQTEHCILAVHGKPVVALTNQTTLVHAPQRTHSQKPEEFYELVESLCSAPRYAELFARSTRPKWDGHGDEVGNMEGGDDAA